jgi:hypothetical protein
MWRVGIPSLRTKLFGFRPNVADSMSDIRAENQRSPSPNPVPVKLEVTFDLAGRDHPRGIEPQRLVDDSV